MDPDLAISIQNVTKTFKIRHEKHNSLYGYLTSIFNNKNNLENLQVLKNISFSVKKGQVVGIIGLNGCGKSTLLKILSKIYFPDSGIIAINGNVTPFLELGLGFNGELTAKDNIIIYGMLLGLERKQIMAKMQSIVEFAEIEKFLDTALKNFSAGMHARLAFATAIHADPDIMLVDEALSVGDLPFQQKCFNIFKEFKKNGKTLVFVSHSIEQIEAICDQVIWLHEGYVKSYGNPANVLNEYKNFVSAPK